MGPAVVPALPSPGGGRIDADNRDPSPRLVVFPTHHDLSTEIALDLARVITHRPRSAQPATKPAIAQAQRAHKTRPPSPPHRRRPPATPATAHQARRDRPCAEPPGPPRQSPLRETLAPHHPRSHATNRPTTATATTNQNAPAPLPVSLGPSHEGPGNGCVPCMTLQYACGCSRALLLPHPLPKQAVIRGTNDRTSRPSPGDPAATKRTHRALATRQRPGPGRGISRPRSKRGCEGVARAAVASLALALREVLLAFDAIIEGKLCSFSVSCLAPTTLRLAVRLGAACRLRKEAGV
jgi:hypothetical protein